MTGIYSAQALVLVTLTAVASVRGVIGIAVCSALSLVFVLWRMMVVAPQFRYQVIHLVTSDAVWGRWRSIVERVGKKDAEDGYHQLHDS